MPHDPTYFCVCLCLYRPCKMNHKHYKSTLMCYNDAMNWWTLIMTLSDVCLATGCTEPEQIFEISTFDINISGEFLKPHHHQRILFLPCIFQNWPCNFLTPGSLATVHRLCLSSVQTPDSIHLRRVCRLTPQCIPRLALLPTTTTHSPGQEDF